MAQQLISTNPATGELVWSGNTGDAAAEVAVARAAWPAWAAHSNSFRIESIRRFANVVRGKENEFAELISRETGKPLWEAKTEVGAVVNKVQISIQAYAERTPQRKMEAALGDRIAVRHKPHGVLAVLGPYNFPAHLPNGHIVPGADRGQRGSVQAEREDARNGRVPRPLFPRSGDSRRRRAAFDRRPRRGPRARKPAGDRRAAVHWLGACRRLSPQAIRRNPAARSWRSSLAATIRSSFGRPRTLQRRRRSSSSRRF